MPIYEFRCKKCDSLIEVFQKLSDKPPTKCKKCGGRLEKQISKTSIQFKGEGWYVTDYARKGSASEKAEKAEKAEKEHSSGETTKSAEKTKPAKTPTKKTDSD
jgi:putative FmdB family regulatory protein